MNSMNDIIFVTTGDCNTIVGDFTVYTGHDVDVDTGAPLRGWMFSIHRKIRGTNDDELLDVKVGFATRKEMYAEIHKTLEVLEQEGEGSCSG